MSGAWWVGQEELDDDQREVMALSLDETALISGPPGSGKTNLLLLRANYLYLSGYKNICVVAFTRSLTQFIATGAHQYDFPSSRITTSRAWQIRLLNDCGHSVPPSTTFEKDREEFAKAVTDAIEQSDLGNMYDAILLDEAQDYLPAEIESFARLTPLLFCAADRKQKIYKSRDSIPSILRHVDKEVPLKFHYRNGAQICRLADGIGKTFSGYSPMIKTAQYDERTSPSTVDREKCQSFDEMAAMIVKRLKTQIATFPSELLGVLCPTHAAVDAIAERVMKSEVADQAFLLRDNTESAFPADRPIVISTIHASKGLEFRAVHLASCEEIGKFPLGREIAFTAITRAKTSLSLYHQTDLPGYLEAALEGLEPPKKPPTMDQVFGRKK